MMDSSTLSILYHEFIRLSVHEQNKEIGKLFIVLGGIRISRHRGEVLEEFRHRTFEKGLKSLPNDCEYQTEFFEVRILPSLLEDFKESTVFKQERLLHKLTEVTNGSIKRKSGESDRGFRVRLYSQLLREIPSGYKFEMMEFAKQFCKSKEDESTFAHSGRGYIQGSKSYSGKVRRGNKVIPSLIEDFKESTVFKQERLLYKLSELTDGASIKRKSGESDRGFRVRLYSQLLQKIPTCNEYEMMEFVKQFVESEEDEFDENQYDQKDELDKNHYDQENDKRYDDEDDNRYDQEDKNQYDDEEENQYDKEKHNQYDQKDKNQYDDEEENQYDHENENQYDDEDSNQYDEENENRYDDEDNNRYDGDYENQYDQENENRYDDEDDNRYDDEDENQYDQENENQYEEDNDIQYDDENDNQYDDEDENQYDQENENQYDHGEDNLHDDEDENKYDQENENQYDDEDDDQYDDEEENQYDQENENQYDDEEDNQYDDDDENQYY